MRTYNTPIVDYVDTTKVKSDWYSKFGVIKDDTSNLISRLRNQKVIDMRKEIEMKLTFVKKFGLVTYSGSPGKEFIKIV